MADRQSDDGRTVTYTFKRGDEHVGFALLSSLIAWIACAAAVLLHVAGAGQFIADRLALIATGISGLFWGFYILIIHLTDGK